MKIDSLIFLGILIIGVSCNMNPRNKRCSELKLILENENFTNHISIYEHTDTLLITDTSRYFSQCHNLIINEKTIRIDTTNNFQFSPHNRDLVDSSRLLLLIKSNDDTLSFGAYYPITNAGVSGYINNNQVTILGGVVY